MTFKQKIDNERKANTARVDASLDLEEAEQRLLEIRHAAPIRVSTYRLEMLKEKLEKVSNDLKGMQDREDSALIQYNTAETRIAQIDHVLRYF